MKHRALFLSLLIFVAPFINAFAQKELTETVDMITLDPPLRMDAGWEQGDMEGEPDLTLPEGYMVVDLWRQDLLYFAVLRESSAGEQEILLLMDVNHDDADNLSYISGSYERSGQKYMYFMMINGETSHGLLYRYDMEDNLFDQTLPGPCSNNMLLLNGMPSKYDALGFVLHQDSILAIDLKTGETIEAVSIAELGGLPEIEGSFFYGQLADGVRKYTYLEAGEADMILLNTIIVNYQDFSDLNKYTAVYSVETKQIVQQWQTEGEF